MTRGDISPTPSVQEIIEGDVLEIDGELFVAMEDAEYVGNTKPFADEGDEYSVKVRGAGSGQRKCHLSEQEGDLYLWSHWDMGYKKREPVNEISRCFRSELSVGE